MVVKIPRKLIKWWKIFSLLEQHELMEKLGTLTSLLDITPRPDLVEAMLTYWDPQNWFSNLENDSFDVFWDEFCTTKAKWKRHHLEDFNLALLGLLVFPLDERHISARLQSVVMTLFHEKQRKTVTVVLMILVELYRALSEVRRGVRYFEGSNLLLQFWMMEHLHTASLLCPIDCALRDRVVCIERRMKFPKFTYPVGFIAWIEFLGLRTNGNVLWAYLWLPLDEILVGCRMQPFLMLIGLKCVRSYTPEPPTLNLRRHIMNFSRKAADEIKYMQYWNNVKRMKKNTLVEDVGRPECTKEYLIWLQSITPGVSTPLPAQFRGRADQTNDFEDASNQDAWGKLELINSQLAGLAANVEQHSQCLFRVGLQDAGAHSRVFIPSIGISLRGMLQSLSMTDSLGPSQPGASHPGVD
ncbi:hypothetical protein A4A49_52216 [Nicotiana attenuata]|uniref:Aminotransferase-like plant mobile domain-containing protein n=1 Tax=Nicotiana attenuata TaxID=49451 RepID=A0A314KWZ6_NICAT|nr:hypothetical protein A4A49_52216 [Nicotiana attenuata]